MVPGLVLKFYYPVRKSSSMPHTPSEPGRSRRLRAAAEPNSKQVAAINGRHCRPRAAAAASP
eukprot:750441-Hanusia_phi.AAC.3